MNKKALIVGINDYGRIKDLRGCLNDTTNMRNILLTYFGFEAEGIRVLADKRATKKNIISRLEWLVEGARPGDHLVFHFSGHGSQILDRNDHDELEDQMDEILCPYDMDWDGTFIIDDDLNRIFSGIREGVLLEVFLDCCHSGTGTRDIGLERPSELGPEDATLTRYLEPPIDIECRWRREGDRIRRRGFRSEGRSTLNHILWSACADFQTSADAQIEGSFNGAFTYYLCRIIRRTEGRITRRDLIQRLSDALHHNRFSQVPQLECRGNLKNEFVLTAKAPKRVKLYKSPRRRALDHLTKQYAHVGKMSAEERKKWFRSKRKSWFNIEQTDALKFFYDPLDVPEAEAFQPYETRDLMGMGKNIGNFFESLERHFQYLHMKNKNVPHIVSEGDSWFLHPLISDIIDWLYGDYAVCDLSAAGDELREMLKQDDFVDAIIDEKPAFFLLSGGGNDFLGEEYFKHFLSTYTPGAPGKNPERFIRAGFYVKLQRIKRNFHRVFERIGSHPNFAKKYTKVAPLNILIHGYDYPIPGTIRKGSWLRVKMLERDINDDRDQNAIVHHMLDRFNDILEEIAANYVSAGELRVHFVDLRGTLERAGGNNTAKQKSLWYDEIHPSDRGYGIIANKFKRTIENLVSV